MFFKPRKMRKLFCTFSALLFGIFITAQENHDADIITKIKKEGLDNSQVMYIAHHLTDVSGPRLTNSPGFFRAATWAKDEMTKWGLENALLEPWGQFGKGWQQQKCYVAMTAPYYQPLIAVPRAWTGSTNKLSKGEITLIKAQDTVDMTKYAGKLKDKIVMTWSSTQLKPSFDADGRRFADTTLDRMAAAEMQTQRGGPNQPQQQNVQRQNQFSRFAVLRRINEMINQEKPALVLSMNANGNDGTVFVSSGGQYTKDAPEAPASVMLSSDDYLRAAVD